MVVRLLLSGVIITIIISIIEIIMNLIISSIVVIIISIMCLVMVSCYLSVCYLSCSFYRRRSSALALRWLRKPRRKEHFRGLFQRPRDSPSPSG